MVSTHHQLGPPVPAGVPDTAFVVTVDDVDGCLAVAGELDHETAPAFAGVVAGQVARCRVDLRVDLSELTFFDLDGVDALLDAQRRLEACGGGLRVVRAGRLLRVVAAVLGHESLFGPAPVAPAPSSGDPRPRDAGTFDG
jgi:anti-anti-sigma factor